MARTTSSTNVISDIWTSYRQQPLWVQIWVGVILMPVNMFSLAFIDQPMGVLIAFLANIAMLMNLPIMLVERGFTRTMALPHLLPWSALVALLIFARPEAVGAYSHYLWILLVVDSISLLFDYPETVTWCRERRHP